jgi:energy-coupling factor transporter ATP-binding protein EcfA2
VETKPTGPQPVKVEIEILETDWEEWKRIQDPKLQIRLLSEWRRKLGKGLLEDEFRMWLQSEYPDRSWEKMTVGEKGELLFSFLQQKGLLNSFKISETTGAVLFLTLGRNNIVLSPASGKKGYYEWVKALLSMFYGTLITTRAIDTFLASMAACAQEIDWSRVDPLDKLRLIDSVVDLNTLSFMRFEEAEDYYFTYCSPLFSHGPLPFGGKDLEERVKDIREGRYDVEKSKLYQLFRPRFSKEDWEYLIDALGCILSPHRHKLLAFIIGPPDSGKSTLLNIVAKPIEPIIARVPLRNLLNYTFGLEPLLGKQVLISYERGEVVLRNLDLLNTVFGECDEIEVPVKYKPFARLRSMKLGLFAMNDPPLVTEYGGETMMAFLNRLSIIHMAKPEDQENIPHLAEQFKPEDAFEFLIWCRVQLEERGWKIRKMDPEAMLEYLKSQANTALRFLEEEIGVSLEEDPNGRIKATRLYELYTEWCDKKGITPLPRLKFYTIIGGKYEAYEREKVKWFKGLRERVTGPRTQDTLYELERFG